jgi:hypothetical protein
VTVYALSARKPRKPRRLMDRLDELTRQLHAAYQDRRRKEETND